MLNVNPSSSRCIAAAFLAVAIAACSIHSSAQGFAGQGTASVQDWSTRHVVFSDPGSERGAIEKGKYDRWWRVTSDPRYIMQQRRRNRSWESPRDRYWQKEVPGPHRDWAFSLGAGTVAQNMSPAKFNFDSNETLTSASCTSDFVVYGLNHTGATGGQANLIALNNLYSGSSPTGLCGATPSVYWSYNATNHAGTVATSPVISYDATGSSIIYVESVSGGSYLHVLKWKAGQGASATNSAAPDTILSAGTGVGSCTAGSSCLVSILLKTASITSSTVTNSSPYYDYANDIVYVGDDSGHLLKVTPVLGSGTPVVTALTVSSGNKLTGPVYDVGSGYVFVGDDNGVLWAVTASTLALPSHSSIQVGYSSCGTSSNALIDPPVVDSSQGFVFETAMVGNGTANRNYTVVVQAFTSSTPNATTGNTNYPGGSGWAAAATVHVGQGNPTCSSSTSNYTHAPSLDNAYYTTPTSGHILVGGTDNQSTSECPGLWSVSFSGSPATLNTPTEFTGTGRIPGGSSCSTNHAEISPITEIYNGTTDYAFFGVGSSSYGQLFGFTVTDSTPFFTKLSASSIGYPTALGGTSGIVVDNVSGSAQASSIYFTTLKTSSGGTPCATGTYCAIKLTQSGLQ